MIKGKKKLGVFLLAFILIFSLNGCFYFGIGYRQIQKYEEHIVAQLENFTSTNFYFEIVFHVTTEQKKQFMIKKDFHGNFELFYKTATLASYYSNGTEVTYNYETKQETTDMREIESYECYPIHLQIIELIKKFSDGYKDRTGRKIPEDGYNAIDITYMYDNHNVDTKNDLALIFFIKETKDDVNVYQLNVMAYDDSFDSNNKTSIYGKLYNELTEPADRDISPKELYEFEKAYQEQSDQ